MEFGIQFFPAVGPQQKSALQYFDESLRLCELFDEYGYTNVRTVEHYFTRYGGYSPNPMIFLTAVAARTRKARLVTGAVLPIFNNPLKVAGEIGMLDAISGGRLDVGFARAFLPHEFRRFGISLDESVARFDEGVEQIRRLLEEENLTMKGEFHSFEDVTSLPRPTQKPRPAFYTAVTTTPESFVKAGRQGHSIMAIPLVGSRMKELIGGYREAWREAGHAGNGRVMLAFHMFCHESRAAAVRIARDPLNRYLKALVEAASDWTTGTSSKDYARYGEMIAKLKQETFESQVESGAAWVGEPAELVEKIAWYDDMVGGFDIASMQINFENLSYDEAAPALRLFGEKVIPHFAGKDARMGSAA